MAQIRHIASGVIYTVSQTPVYVKGVWECGDQRFIDSGGQYDVPTVNAGEISRTRFLLQFSSAERVIARSLRSSDAILNDFWLVLESSETVDLSLETVQNGIEYTLTVIKNNGIPALNVATRKAEIIAGVLQ